MTPEDRAGEAFSGWMTDEQLAEVAQVIAGAVAAERQRLRGLLVEASETIRGLADQQAMVDDWFEPVLKKLDEEVTS